jgi:hypothetical protein
VRKWAFRVFRGIVVGCVIASAAVVVTHAQWLKLTLPDTPRNADGTPDLTAPTPRFEDHRPDLTGIWRLDPAVVRIAQRRGNAAGFANGPFHLSWLMPEGAEIPLVPSAAAVYASRAGQLGKSSPASRCVAHGIPDAMLITPTKIISTRRVTAILFEEFNHYRQVFTDGRRLPDDPQPTWLGYSVGRWDGDTFVVETSGFNDQSWMDDAGLPHSDALKTTERFLRKDFGHLAVNVIFEDRKTFSRTWSLDLPFVLMPDTELFESICENEKDAAHLVGK